MNHLPDSKNHDSVRLQFVEMARDIDGELFQFFNAPIRDLISSIVHSVPFDPIEGSSLLAGYKPR